MTVIRRACTLDDRAYLIRRRFTPAQSERICFMRWAYLTGRLGEYPARCGARGVTSKGETAHSVSTGPDHA